MALVAESLVVGCGQIRNLRKGDSAVGLNLPLKSGSEVEPERVDRVDTFKLISFKKQDGSEVFFAPAVVDSLTGEKLMSVAIDEVVISAMNRRNVVERNGKIIIDFVVTVPEAFQNQGWQLQLDPLLKKGPDTVALDGLVYSGYRFRAMQEREYERYGAYLNRIVDSADYFDRFGDKKQYDSYMGRIASEQDKYKNQDLRLRELTPDDAELDATVGWITPRERQRQYDLLRHYVRSTDRKVARNTEYTPNANDKFDHLNDFLAPRYRFEGVDVLPGGAVFTRVDGAYVDADDRNREGYVQTTSQGAQTRRRVKIAPNAQLNELVDSRLTYTGLQRPMMEGILRELTDSARYTNYAARRSYTEGQLEFLGLVDTVAVRSEAMHWGKIARNEERVADTMNVFKRLVRNPYINSARLDTTIYQVDGSIKYLYSQEVMADENTSKLFLFLNGSVEDCNGRRYKLQKSDTLTYNVASMTTFVDETPRYQQRIILRDAEANARFFFTFPVGESELIDTMAVNRQQLVAVRDLTRKLMTDPVYIVDSITLRATSSPDGRWKLNERLARERAEALRGIMLAEVRTLSDSLRVSASVTLDDEGHVVVKKVDESLPDLSKRLRTEWLAEDWDTLRRLIEEDTVIDFKEKQALYGVMNQESDPDDREWRLKTKHRKSFEYIGRVLYPRMRAVDFRFNLHRRGMLQDTVYTTEIDSAYMNAIENLKKRRYEEALTTLRPYEDRNTALAYMSLGYDAAAYRILRARPESATTADLQYMLAILAVRVGEETEAVRYFMRSTELRENLKFRGNLDPEISGLIRKYGLFKEDFM